MSFIVGDAKYINGIPVETGTPTSDATWAGTIDNVALYKVTPANVSVIAFV